MEPPLGELRFSHFIPSPAGGRQDREAKCSPSVSVGTWTPGVTTKLWQVVLPTDLTSLSGNVGTILSNSKPANSICSYWRVPPVHPLCWLSYQSSHLHSVSSHVSPDITISPNLVIFQRILDKLHMYLMNRSRHELFLRRTFFKSMSEGNALLSPKCYDKYHVCPVWGGGGVAGVTSLTFLKTTREELQLFSHKKQGKSFRVSRALERQRETFPQSLPIEVESEAPTVIVSIWMSCRSPDRNTKFYKYWEDNYTLGRLRLGGAKPTVDYYAWRLPRSEISI